MERTLNVNDGWEAVVNNPDRRERIDRFQAKRKEVKLNKLSARGIVYAVLALVYGFAGITGIMAEWLGLSVGFVLLMISTFNFGRYCQLRGW